jgi:hypothetical protein
VRALSIPQPWAQLVIRGVKTVEVRSWYAKHAGGRIAIHASANIEFKKVETLWRDDRAVARCFADQGWASRDDLRALPRSAILGTVELRGVHPAKAVRAARINPSATDWISETLDNAVRDPVSGGLRPGPLPVRTLPVEIPAGGFVFGFASPLEVEPLADVDGQQHLWALPAPLATELAAREARARSGAWTRSHPSSERVKAAQELWRERFATEETRYAVRLMREAIDEAANDELTLEDEQAERMLKRGLTQLARERGERGEDGRDYIRLPRALRSLWDGESRVALSRVETDLRMLLHTARYRAQEAEAYGKVLNEGLALLREGLARADESPTSRAALEAEVKRHFKRSWAEAEAAMERADRIVEIPDY